MIGGARHTKRRSRHGRKGGMRGSQNLALNALLTGMVLSRGKKHKGKKSRRGGRKSRRGGRTRRH